jgi:hypothetical protein
VVKILKVNCRYLFYFIFSEETIGTIIADRASNNLLGAIDFVYLIKMYYIYSQDLDNFFEDVIDFLELTSLLIYAA